MPKKIKLNLEELSVKSFQTDSKKDDQLKGGLITNLSCARPFCFRTK